MNVTTYGSAMFNCGMLYVMLQGVHEPLRSALLDQLFRIMADMDKDMKGETNDG